MLKLYEKRLIYYMYMSVFVNTNMCKDNEQREKRV